ncbi:MAG: hypothetical protein LBS16_07810 [Prevotellaceae bacterium]|jgi:hypothetical protein|nr:hypothetical protein [Prevotellaceae bacterium]
MAEEHDITKAHIDMLETFTKLFRAFFGKKEPDEYFKLNLPEDKPYIELTSLLDNRTYPCYSQQDLQNSMRDIIGRTDMYDDLLRNAAHPDFSKPDEALTPELFNWLGGKNSPLLLNTDNIVTFNNELKLNLIKGSAQKGIDAVYIKPMNNNEYGVTFYQNAVQGELKSVERLINVKTDDLQKEIMRVTQLNEKACFENKEGKKLFSEDEVPKNDLKKAGIEWNKLSEVNKKSLLEGKETSKLTFSQKAGGKKYFTHGHLQLSRIGGKNAQALFRPAEQGPKIKKGIKF